MSDPELVDQPPRFFSQFEKEGYYKKDAVHLECGSLGTDQLRMLPPIIEAATAHLMQVALEGDAQIFQYGAENGNWQFRSFLSKFLSEEYGDFVDSEQLFLNSGATSGLWLVLSALLKPRSIVFVEDPTYFCAIKFVKDLDMTIVPVKTDDGGLVVEDLHRKLIENFSEDPSACFPPVRALLYLIPTFHNPTGSSLPYDRCNEVIRLSRKYGMTVLCDDVYNLLHYDNSLTCPKRLFSFDKKSDASYVGNVISNCTFSKVLGPGLRVGWMEVPKWTTEKLENFGVLVSGGGLNTYTGGIITSLLALGKMKLHLEMIRTTMKASMDATAELLQSELPPGCTLKSPAKGGYFLWIELPVHIKARDLLPFAKKEYQVAFAPGVNSSPTGSFTNYIRICITFYPLDILLSAVRRLCLAIADYQTRFQEDPNFNNSPTNV